MNAPLLHCPKCQSALLDGVFNQGGFVPCPSCATPLQVEVYPAMFRERARGSAGELILTEAEASCFYHPRKKAVQPCEECGRFLCALCDCEHQGKHLCPACLESGRTKGKIKSLENARTRYDNIALALALYPLLIFYLTLITAPMALFVAIRYWKAPRGLAQPSSLGFVVAILVATLELGGWTMLFIGLATR
jgi:hypothetical protein